PERGRHYHLPGRHPPAEGGGGGTDLFAGEGADAPGRRQGGGAAGRAEAGRPRCYDDRSPRSMSVKPIQLVTVSQGPRMMAALVSTPPVKVGSRRPWRGARRPSTIARGPRTRPRGGMRA